MTGQLESQELVNQACLFIRWKELMSPFSSPHPALLTIPARGPNEIVDVKIFQLV